MENSGYLGVSLAEMITVAKNEIRTIETAPEKEEKTVFPLDLFPDWLKSVINDHSDSYGTPKELWAMAFLSGISAAAGKRFRLITDYTNFPQLWLMVVGRSGSGKSEPFNAAFRRLNEVDRERFLEYQAAYKEWEQEKAGSPPRWEQICINDSTPEGLFHVLSHSENGLTLYRDELSG